jgi:hypothetical protein
VSRYGLPCADLSLVEIASLIGCITDNIGIVQQDKLLLPALPLGHHRDIELILPLLLTFGICELAHGCSPDHVAAAPAVSPVTTVRQRALVEVLEDFAVGGLDLFFALILLPRASAEYDRLGTRRLQCQQAAQIVLVQRLIVFLEQRCDIGTRAAPLGLRQTERRAESQDDQETCVSS